MKTVIINAAAVKVKPLLNEPVLVIILITLPEIRPLSTRIIVITICNARYATATNLAKILNV